MDDAAYIIGLMKTNTSALGFIPSPAIRQRWIRLERYVIQRDARGRPRGYVLHGPPLFGRPLFINQACIDYDHRLRGFGLLAIRTVLGRALAAGSTLIRLRCAHDLPANAFWHAAGFHVTGCRPGGKQRHRYIVTYELKLNAIPALLDPPPSLLLSPRSVAERVCSAT